MADEGQPRPTWSELDLAQTEGLPTPAAEEAYVRDRTYLKFQGRVLGANVETVVSALDKSPVLVTVAYGATVLPAALIAFVLHVIGLGPAPAGIAAGVVWVATLALCFITVRRTPDS